MAMPASGSLGIKICPGSVACTSISQAVDGNVTGDKSLSTLSTTAGKSAPHCMREFYGYASATLCVNPTSALLAVFPSICGICVCASASNDWCAIVDPIDDTWINITTPATCCGTGSGMLCFGAVKNASGPERYGTICVDSSAPTACIDVTQLGGI